MNEEAIDPNEQSDREYPAVVERVKAAMADSVVLVLLMIGLTKVFSSFDSVSESARIIGFVFVFLLYDPLFTSLFGGTIGHMMIGIRVKRIDNLQKNIVFPLAIIRYLIKVLLGWVSFFTIGGNDYHQAIHDKLVDSVVVYKNDK